MQLSAAQLLAAFGDFHGSLLDLEHALTGALDAVRAGGPLTDVEHNLVLSVDAVVLAQGGFAQVIALLKGGEGHGQEEARAEGRQEAAAEAAGDVQPAGAVTQG